MKKINFTQIRKKYFPVMINDIKVEVSNEAEVYKAYFELGAKIFKKNPQNQYYRASQEQKKKDLPLLIEYRKLHHEWFVFKNKKNEIIGWCMGEADDHHTFYLRNTGILPKYQNRKIYTEFSKQLFNYLKALGYNSVTSQHQVSNQRILILKLKQGFMIKNLELTENWGPLVKLVKFFNMDRQNSYIDVYGDQFHKQFYKE